MPYIKCVNTEQVKSLEELKNRVKSELESPALLEDDALFYKFLKARDFNIDKAERMLRKHIIWRKAHQVDQILENFKPKEYFVKCAEPNLLGFDKDGDVVRYIAVGRMNSIEVFKCIKMNECVRHWIWFAEKNKQLTNKAGKKTSISVIVDLEKLELQNVTSKLTADIILRLAHMIRDNYAERVKALYMINAPSYFVLIYAIIKAVMSHSMIKKMHVFGYSGWKEKLLEVIDADVLPGFLGGKRIDPDGDHYCRSFITLCEKIPEKYYLSEEERYFEDSDDVTTLVIPPSEKKEVFIHIKEVESSIRWKFMVHNKTIRFGLFLEDLDDKIKEILPMYEYDTTDGSEESSYKCFSKGKYIIIFDNSHSRFSSKEIQYSIYVEKWRIQH